MRAALLLAFGLVFCLAGSAFAQEAGPSGPKLDLSPQAVQRRALISAGATELQVKDSLAAIAQKKDGALRRDLRRILGAKYEPYVKAVKTQQTATAAPPAIKAPSRGNRKVGKKTPPPVGQGPQT